MDESVGYIKKRKQGAGFFDELFAEGIETLQKLSADNWTDYNHHDPGVTLLESIIYAMSEIDFKTESRMEDLLLTHEGDKLRSGDNGMFVSSDILTTNPITINDMRKVIVDKVKMVKNVWISTLTSEYQFKGVSVQIRGLSGLYSISVEMDMTTTETFEEVKDQVIRDVRRVFYEHRNICEYLYDINVYKPYEIEFKIDITIDDAAKGETVLATVINQINGYLSQEVQFKSLWELEKTFSTAEIFNGPRLKSGFVRDESLKERRETVQVLELINLVAGVEGVISVNSMELMHQPDLDEEFVLLQKEFLTIPDGFFPSLKVPEHSENVVFRSVGLRYHADINEVRNELAYLDSVKYGNLKTGTKTSNEIPIPEGKYLNIKSYYPVRFHLPDHYGVGENGLISGLEPLRYAQARQLRSYLMPIDQIMANMLGLISNLNQLYDTSDNHQSSYFSELLEDVDESLELMDVSPDKSKKEQINEWTRKLGYLDKKFDRNRTDRLHRVTDDLLARFSEVYPAYSLSKTLSQIYPFLNEKEISSRILKAKRHYINHYESISYNRAKSCNYFQLSDYLRESRTPEEMMNILPGVVRKIASLAAVEDFSIRSLTGTVEDRGLSLYESSEKIDNLVERLKQEGKEDVRMDIEDYPLLEGSGLNLNKSFYFYGTPNDVLKDVLKFGIRYNNYRIKSHAEGTKQITQVWLDLDGYSLLVHANDEKKKAEKYLEKCIAELREINVASEGLFFVEHIVLMPALYQANFGFSISFKDLHNSLKLEMVHVKRYAMGERHAVLEQLITGLMNKTLRLTINNEYGKYFVELRQNGALLAVSKKRFSEEELDQLCTEVDRVYRCIEQAEFGELKMFIRKFTRLVFYDENVVDEAFFASRISFILPDWPVRFQEENFREFIESTVYEVIPIHLVSNLYLLDYREFGQFETLYFSWIRSFTSAAENERESKAYELVRFLIGLKVKQDKNE